MSDLGMMPMNGAAMPPPMMNGGMTAIPPAAMPLAPMPAVQLRKPLPAKLRALLDSENIVADLTEEQRAEIAAKVVDEYQIDKDSRSQLDEVLEEATDLAMLVAEEKTYPFDKASNVKYPLITTAALQFNARAYAAIVQGNRAAKCVTWGADPDGHKASRAERVAEHLSYQLLAKMPEWEEDTDRLTIIVSIDGSVFRKVFYDPAVKRNVTRLVRAKSLVVNYWARSLEDVPRITEEMLLYPYEVQERIRANRFIEFDYANLPKDEPDDTDEVGDTTTEDPDGPMLFLEQHRLLDLDEDGYPEPYIATVHKESQKLCRLVANFDEKAVEFSVDGSIASIRRNTYYTKYTFLPSPDGGFYGLGFGWLLKATNESINSTLNLMFDAAHLANMQGGFVGGTLGLKDRTMRFKMGEWKVVPVSGSNLSQNIVPIKYDGPNAVMFQLLGLLIEAGKELASVKDVLTGDTPATAPVGTTLAMIEQGLQVFTAIYKRLHRSLKGELGMLAKLNRQYLDPAEYARFHDMKSEAPAEQPQPGQPMALPAPVPTPESDYAEEDMDILPLTDPQSVTKMQKVAKAQAINQLEPADDPNPVMDKREKVRRVLEALDIEDIDKLIPEPQPPDPAKVELMQRGATAEVALKEAQANKTQAEAVKTKNESDQAAMMPSMADSQPMPPPAPMPTPHEIAIQQEELAGKQLDNIKKRADIASMGDVVPNEDGTVENKTNVMLQAVIQGQQQMADAFVQSIDMLGRLVAQGAEAQRQGDERIVQTLMAPVVKVVNDKGEIVAAQRVVN